MSNVPSRSDNGVYGSVQDGTAATGSTYCGTGRRSKTSNGTLVLAIVNMVAYIVNVLVNGIGANGLFNLPSNIEVSAKYQTLVTPAGFSFSIWSVIFLSQLVWTIRQFFLVKFPVSSSSGKRNMPYKYVWVVIFQTAWTILFSLEWITASGMAMYAILYSLGRIVWMDYVSLSTESSDDTATTTAAAENLLANEATSSTNPPREEEEYQDVVVTRRYWLDVFPFTIHFGWICVASVVNTNIVLVGWTMMNDNNNDIIIEYYVALSSLCIVLIAGVVTIFKFGFVTIPTVYAWGLFGIYSLLSKNISSTVAERYSTNQINVIEEASLCITVLIVVCIGINLAMKLASR